MTDEEDGSFSDALQFDVRLLIGKGCLVSPAARRRCFGAGRSVTG